MNYTVLTYVLYLAISIGLTIWVAQVLFKNGRFFMVEIFRKNEELASAVNKLLLVGFYLINFGYATLSLKKGYAIESSVEMIEALSVKVGVIILVLGGMHFLNLFILFRLRKRAQDEAYADEKLSLGEI